MRRLRRNLLASTAVLGAAVVLYLAWTLPPRTRHLATPPSNTIYGAFHIHTNRSDGSGSLDEVAEAAAAAGLRFVIVTDHGDATREPAPPQYRHGVLTIDAVEISTISGHMIALGLRGAAPYPLGGEARDTLEDLHRLGGWGVAAHPDSPRGELRWRGDELPIDAIEWLNADSEWRDERSAALAVALGHYLFRPPESIAAIFERPAASLQKWDDLSRTRKVVGLAGVDAHARIGFEENGSAPASGILLARPSYEDMFRTVVQGIPLAGPLSGDAAMDAVTILESIREGRTFSVVSAIAEPGSLTFTASDGNRVITMGDSFPDSSPVTIVASVPEPADARVVLLRNGEEVAAGEGAISYRHTGAPAAYRVEVRIPMTVVPWIVSNAIRVGETAQPLAGPPPTQSLPTLALQDAAAWISEKHANSSGAVTADDGEVALKFKLGPGPLDGQYAAMSYPLAVPGGFGSVTATLRASAPMRVSVQVRRPVGGEDGERWQRSVYVDRTPREVTLWLDDFQGAGEVSTPRPSPADIRSLLFVVDTWHTKPGTEGTFWVSGVRLGLTSGR